MGGVCVWVCFMREREREREREGRVRGRGESLSEKVLYRTGRVAFIVQLEEGMGWGYEAVTWGAVKGQLKMS